MLPSTTEELAALQREAAARRHTVAPTGAGTKRHWGHPLTPDQQISTLGLTGLREHSWQDLTCTVAAGTPWAQLQAELARHRQRVAVDPLFADRATVGGVLATNDCGLLRLRYGGLRDLVLGMTVVLADGTLARTGGKVVKNVAGYDLPKLLTGSFGTLGIITEATFRLHPLQAHSAAFTVRSTEIAPLAELMHALVTSAMGLERMQLRPDPGPPDAPTAFAVDLEFAAVPEALADHEQRLRVLAGSPALTIEPCNAAERFLARQRLFDDPHATVLKLTSLPTKLSALVSGFAQLARDPALTAACVADPVGVVTAALTGPAASLVAILADLRARLYPVGGAAVVLQRGALPAEVDPWNDPQHPPPALQVMRAIKHEFDPGRLLNPGRFVGGL